MSRSHRHTPIHGNCAGSEKQDKQLASRKLRRTGRVCDRYTFAKDGKHRFDPIEQPELMRK